MAFSIFNRCDKAFNIKQRRRVVTVADEIALNILASVGTSSCPASIGSQAITGVGFQPTLVMPFMAASSTTPGSHARFGIGGATGSSNEFSTSVYSTSGLTTSDTGRRHTASNVISRLENAGPAELIAELTSLDTDGFSLNWSAVRSGHLFNHIALGGADLEVSITQQQMNNTNAAQSFAHGLSGAPTGVLFVSSFDAASPPSTISFLSMGIGAWTSGSQFGASLFSWNNVTTTDTKRKLTNNAVLDWIYPTTQRRMIVSSVDASNVNVSYETNVFVDARRFYMIAIRGAKCKTGTFDCNGSTNPLTIDCVGIMPKLFMPVFVLDGVDNPGTVQNNAILTLGASDGVNNVSCGISDQTAVTTTNARRWQSSTALAEYSQVGGLAFSATASFVGESVVLTPTTIASSSYGQGGYIIIGA